MWISPLRSSASLLWRYAHFQRAPKTRRPYDLTLDPATRQQFVDVAWSEKTVEAMIEVFRSYLTRRQQYFIWLVPLVIALALASPAMLANRPLSGVALVLLVCSGVVYLTGLKMTLRMTRETYAAWILAKLLNVIDRANSAISADLTMSTRLSLARAIRQAEVRFTDAFPARAGRRSRPKHLQQVARRCAEDLQSWSDEALTGDLNAVETLRDEWIRYVLRIVGGSWTEVHRSGTTFVDLKKVRFSWNRSLASGTTVFLLSLAGVVLTTLTLIYKP